MPDPYGFVIVEPSDCLDEEIARLARLPPIDYDRERGTVAKRLGCRLSTLDTRVFAARPRTESKHGRDVTLPTHEPWPDRVDLGTTIDALAQQIRQHVIVSAAASDVLSLWIAHTWVYRRFEKTPRLSVTSPVKRCGKSTLLDVLFATCCRPLRADNISAAGIFRTVEALSPLTLLVDEADTFLPENEELRGVLNSGFASEGGVIRIEEVKNEFKPVRFRTFAPVAMAGIGNLPSTLEDRSIPILLHRKAAAERVVKLRAPGARSGLHDLGRKLSRWAEDREDALGTAPSIPDALGDREGDISVPLLAIADDAGVVWSDRARRAVMELFGVRADEEGGAETGSLLLTDVRAIFSETGAERLPSLQLCKALGEMEHRPWPEWRAGKPITPVQLARQLRPFGVKPTTIRFTGFDAPAKGYYRDHFGDAWSRYLGVDRPSSSPYPLSTRNGGYTADSAGFSGESDPLQDTRDVTGQTGEVSLDINGVTPVTAQTPPEARKGSVRPPIAEKNPVTTGLLAGFRAHALGTERSPLTTTTSDPRVGRRGASPPSLQPKGTQSK